MSYLRNPLLPGDVLYFWPVEDGPEAEPFPVYVVAPPRRVGFELGKTEAILLIDAFDREVGLRLVGEVAETHMIAGDSYILCTHFRDEELLQDFRE